MSDTDAHVAKLLEIVEIVNKRVSLMSIAWQDTTSQVANLNRALKGLQEELEVLKTQSTRRSKCEAMRHREW